MEEIFIVGAARTPIGSVNGTLSTYTAPQLGAKALSAALERAGVAPEKVDEVIMGNVVSAGIGQAPARQAAIGAKIPVSAGATTVNKVCGSGLKAVMMGAQSILLGDSKIVAAGGMESMTNSPYMLEKARGGYRYGHGVLVDSILKDGLWDPYGNMHMGMCGEMCSEKHQISREEQDEWAKRSYERAQASKEFFKTEIVPVDGLAEDEEPGRARLDKMARLKPAFKNPGGTITAANASKINDGAAAVVLAPASKVKELGLKPLGRIVGWATHSQEPEWFTTAPAGAIEKLLKKVGWSKDQVDLYEVNEAFAVVTLAVAKLTGIDKEKVNIHGGAVALGHPLGASGARILVTLLHALRQKAAQPALAGVGAAFRAGSSAAPLRGVAAICLGGGESVAMAVELVA